MSRYDVAMACTGKGWRHGPLFAFGAAHSTDEYAGTFLSRFARLQNDFRGDYIFGHAGYGLKKETESVDSIHASQDGFADLFFFVPTLIVLRKNDEWHCGYFEEAKADELLFFIHKKEDTSSFATVELLPVTSQREYETRCRSLLKHIHRGDIYEINYCIDFTGKSAAIDPVEMFRRLQALSDAPMSALYRCNQAWLACASPERFVARNGNTLISQPIKGTIRRGADEQEDELLKEQLRSDPKERSENVMIVDLVRNDLSRVATKGSVRVTELFGIHTFRTVHQMISTIACEVKPGVHVEDIFCAAFPMGSMTGAPKISAMKLAETHESQSRGIYSGTVGYITPEGDFDFNVVIRSITWNSETGHVSAKAGSAITALSDPGKEYEECLLKAKAMMRALQQ